MSPIRETHAGGVIRVTPTPGAWGSVPLSLIEDGRLDLDSRAVAAWLATRPDGWQISVAHLLAALRLGRDRWRRIAAELELAGYLTRSPTPSGPSGRWVWEIVFCAAPASAALAGGPAESRRPHQPPEHQPPEKRGAPPLQSPRARRARVVLETDARTGIQHDPYNERDVAAVAAICKFPAPDIGKAVTLAAAQDDRGRAFPSAVLRHLRRPVVRQRDDTPAWAQAGAAGSSSDLNIIIDGDVKWTG